MIAQKAVAAKSRSARADRKLGISVGTEALSFGGLASPYFELRKDRDGFHYSRSKIFDNKTNKFNFVS